MVVKNSSMIALFIVGKNDNKIIITERELEADIAILHKIETEVDAV